MIGVVSTKGVPEPIYRPFSRIKKGDRIVYYAIRDSVLVGVFTVTSSMEYLDDSEWGPSCIYRISPSILPPAGKVLDFKSLIEDSSVKLDFIPQKRFWASYLRGHANRPLTEQDFALVVERIRHGPGLVLKPPVRPP